MQSDFLNVDEGDCTIFNMKMAMSLWLIAVEEIFRKWKQKRNF